MSEYLPGTAIEYRAKQKGAAAEVLDNIFSCGGLVLSQVTRLTGLEMYVVQNWVKRGFVSPPQKKQYSRRQFCRLAIINMLKESLQIEKIVNLLSYINGQLDDESDDMIDDSKLYEYYSDAISLLMPERNSEEDVKNAIESAICDYREPYAGAKRKLFLVLQVMAYAHYATEMRRRAEIALCKLD